MRGTGLKVSRNILVLIRTTLVLASRRIEGLSTPGGITQRHSIRGAGGCSELAGDEESPRRAAGKRRGDPRESRSRAQRLPRGLGGCPGGTAGMGRLE